MLRGFYNHSGNRQIDGGLTIQVHHITYATAGFALSAWLLGRSARRFGIHTRVYDPSGPVSRELAQRYPEIMRARRGAGYWLWKPYILRDALARAADGDVVFYTDAAVFIAADPAPLIGLTRDHPVVIFELLANEPASIWTKRDCFVLLDADSEPYWNVPMCVATFQLYRAGPEARSFVDALCAASSDIRVLGDDPNVMGLPNRPGFRAHRHDQSVLTIVSRKWGLPRFPDPSQWGPGAPRSVPLVLPDGIERPPAPYGVIIQHHRRKNNKVLQWYARRQWQLSGWGKASGSGGGS